jgi:hypothetical protein
MPPVAMFLLAHFPEIGMCRGRTQRKKVNMTTILQEKAE